MRRCQSCAAVATGHAVRHGLEFMSCGAEVCGERLLGGVRIGADADTVLFHERTPMVRALNATLPALLGVRSADGHYALRRDLATLLSRGLECERVGPEQEDDATPGSRKRTTDDDDDDDARSPNEFSYLFNLPMELWFQVLVQLNPRELAAFSGTSRDARNIATTPRVLGTVLAAHMRPAVMVRLYFRLWHEHRVTPSDTRANFMEALRFALPGIESRIAVAVLGRHAMTGGYPREILYAAITAFTRYNTALPTSERDLSWFTASTPVYPGGPMAAAVVYLAMRFFTASPRFANYVPEWLGALTLQVRAAPLETPASTPFWIVASEISCDTVAQLRDSPDDEELVIFDPPLDLVKRGVTFNRPGVGAALLSLANNRVHENTIIEMIHNSPTAVEWSGRARHDGPISYNALALAVQCSGLLFQYVVSLIGLVRLNEMMAETPTDDERAPETGGVFFHLVVRKGPFSDRNYSRQSAGHYARVVDMCTHPELFSRRNAAGNTPLLALTLWGAPNAQLDAIATSDRCSMFRPLVANDTTGRTALDNILGAPNFNHRDDGFRFALVEEFIQRGQLSGAMLDTPSGAPHLIATLALLDVTASPNHALHLKITHLFVDIVNRLPTPATASGYRLLARWFERMLHPDSYEWLATTFIPRLGHAMARESPDKSFVAMVSRYYRINNEVSYTDARRLVFALLQLETSQTIRRAADTTADSPSGQRPLLSRAEWQSAGYLPNDA